MAASKTVRDLLNMMGIEAKDSTSPYLDVPMVITDPAADERQLWKVEAIVPDGLSRVVLHWGDPL